MKVKVNEEKETAVCPLCSTCNIGGICKEKGRFDSMYTEVYRIIKKAPTAMTVNVSLLCDFYTANPVKMEEIKQELREIHEIKSGASQISPFLVNP